MAAKVLCVFSENQSPILGTLNARTLVGINNGFLFLILVSKSFGLNMLVLPQAAHIRVKNHNIGCAIKYRKRKEKNAAPVPGGIRTRNLLVFYSVLCSTIVLQPLPVLIDIIK